MLYSKLGEKINELRALALAYIALVIQCSVRRLDSMHAYTLSTVTAEGSQIKMYVLLIMLYLTVRLLEMMFHLKESRKFEFIPTGNRSL